MFFELGCQEKSLIATQMFNLFANRYYYDNLK